MAVHKVVSSTSLPKSGSNDFHGDVFGYLRNKSFQARNPFSRSGSTRPGIWFPHQAGLHSRSNRPRLSAAPLKKDKTFFFFSYEYTQREENPASPASAKIISDSPPATSRCIANPRDLRPHPPQHDCFPIGHPTMQPLVPPSVGNPANCTNPGYSAAASGCGRYRCLFQRRRKGRISTSTSTAAKSP